MTSIPQILSELDGSLAQLQQTLAASPWMAGLKRYEVRLLWPGGVWSQPFNLFADNIEDLRSDFLEIFKGRAPRAFIARETPNTPAL